MPETPDVGTLEVPTPDPVPTHWETVAAALKQSPGQWRRINTPAASTVATTNITRGVLAPFRPAGAFEAVRRDGELFARYLPTDLTELSAAIDRLVAKGAL